jgi:hypothetical protein
MWILMAVFAPLVSKTPVAHLHDAAGTLLGVTLGASEIDVTAGQGVFGRLVIEARRRPPEVGGMTLTAQSIGELGAVEVVVTRGALLDIDLLVVTALTLRLAEKKRRHAFVVTLFVVRVALLALELSGIDVACVSEIAAEGDHRSRLGSAMAPIALRIHVPGWPGILDRHKALGDTRLRDSIHSGIEQRHGELQVVDAGALFNSLDLTIGLVQHRGRRRSQLGHRFLEEFPRYGLPLIHCLPPPFEQALDPERVALQA